MLCARFPSIKQNRTSDYYLIMEKVIILFLQTFAESELFPDFHPSFFNLGP